MTYDGLIILCRNWRGYPWKHKLVNGILDINLASKMSCSAAARMYLDGKTKKILFGSGKTAGKENRSETEGMKTYLLRKFPTIPEEDILTQETNLDTYQELDENLRVASQNGLVNLALMTVDTQIPRCKAYFEKQRRYLDYFSTEEEFSRQNPRYKKLAVKYQDSIGVKYYETFKEFALRGLQKLGITGKFTVPIARLVRR